MTGHGQRPGETTSFSAESDLEAQRAAETDRAEPTARREDMALLRQIRKVKEEKQEIMEQLRSFEETEKELQQVRPRSYGHARGFNVPALALPPVSGWRRQRGDGRA